MLLGGGPSTLLPPEQPDIQTELRRISELKKEKMDLTYKRSLINTESIIIEMKKKTNFSNE